MKTILVLGATGRTGRSVLKHRPDGATVYAAVRRAGPGAPLPEGADAQRVVDIEDQAGLSAALEGVDAVINAIRLRGDIAATALVGLHQSIVAARDTNRDLHVVHVGGAGSLRVGGGRRFWQAPGFPATTLPRGISHARLRDYLEQDERGCRRPASTRTAPSGGGTPGSQRVGASGSSWMTASATRTSPSRSSTPWSGRGGECG